MARPVTPARAYFRAGDIPPPGIAAYGIVAFRSKPTDATRVKLLHVCEAFKAFLPRQSSLPPSIALRDQMLTIWPLDDPDAPDAKADDCKFLTEHYDLFGGISAIQDASIQGVAFDGEGPFLIGWSPSITRGMRDKVVLVIDMSDVQNQDSLNALFLFWQKKVVENPSLWRRGFSMQRVRLSVREFVDRYGQDILTAVKMTGGSK